MIKVTETAGAITFAVRVQPRASENSIVGELEGALKVRLAAPPVDGAANAELIKVIATLFGIGRNQVEIRAGASGRQKLVRVHGCSLEEAQRVLASVKMLSDE
jgi:uncharacterized protein (TIGR00251 family)